MTPPTKGASERIGFYPQTIHVLFAVIIGYSFFLASDVMIPIQNVLESDNHTAVLTLGFSYILVISGWVGYSRSVSTKPYTDSNLGAMRFVVDLIVLFEYFYLISISQTEHASEFPAVAVIIFGTYVLWDDIKGREYASRDQENIQRRKTTTKKLFIVGIVIAAAYHVGLYKIMASSLGISEHMLAVLSFVLLVIGYRYTKWDLTPRRRGQNLKPRRAP